MGRKLSVPGKRDLQLGCSGRRAIFLVIARPVRRWEFPKLRRLARFFRRVMIAPDGLDGPLRPLDPWRHVGLPHFSQVWRWAREVWLVPDGAPIPDPEQVLKGPNFGVIVLDKPSIPPHNGGDRL